ncbi:MAG: ribonuclease Z [Lachnospiraceae bacterium]|jgi:ribonuclease Z|nr:ribonuclease Z [Lachnospiraceae bacterium]MBR3278126.1 ribonuclease Z [Lachnospiraceae bacterium]MBR6399076.1 ribonuclease Z [Lachnospiraceae bacterium]
MLDVSLLGTGGMMPLPKRWVTSCLMRYNGASLLIDCGEGTQIALREKGWSFKPINTILLTHFHADHIAGLPGFLLTMGNSDRTEPVRIIGPKGTPRMIAAVRTLAPELPFNLEVIEIESSEQTFHVDGMDITAFRVNHNITCYGYEVSIKRSGKFDAERARKNQIPLKFWNPLQKGQTIESDGRVFTPDMVLGAERKGLKVVYTTDTRPTESIGEHAKGADLFICEGMYGEPGMEKKAREHRHMTMMEAAEIARKAEPARMWLTHFSPSLVRPDLYMNTVREVFPEAIAARDGQEITLNFEEE